MRFARRAGAVLVAAAFLGCPTDDAPSDRAIEKLKAEQARLANGGAPSGPPKAARPRTPEDDLADTAVAARAPRPVQVVDSQGSFGALVVTVKEAEVSQTVKGAKTALTTSDRYLRLVIHLRATSADSFDPSGAVLAKGDQTAPVARDAQRLGHGAALARTTLRKEEEGDVALYFEVPASFLGPGLTLKLAEPDRTLALPVF